MNHRPMPSGFKLVFASALLASTFAGCQKTPEPAPEPASAEVEDTAPASNATPNLATLSPFEGVIPAEAANTQCALDMVNGQAPATGVNFGVDGSMAVGGWIGDGAGNAATGFQLVMKGAAQSFSTPVTTGIARQDVADSLAAAGLADSGFTSNFALAGLPAGEYSMYFLDPSNPEASACDPKYSINIQ